MSHEVKTCTAQFKTAETTAEDGTRRGEVTALVSVFGNVDYGGDRVMPGAFAKSLAAWQAKGDPIPFIWSHAWDDPDAYVGTIDPADAKETDAGLEVKATMFLDQPKAAQVFNLLDKRVVTQFSFGYQATETAMVTEGEGEVIRELHAVDLFEAGPTLLGLNPDTQLIEAASLLHGKAGRTLSGKNEQALRDAALLIEGVLDSLPAEGDDTGKTGLRDTAATMVPESPSAVLAFATLAPREEGAQA